MMIFLLGCPEQESESAPEPVAESVAFAPAAGDWDVAVDAEWAGDCLLDDPATGRGDESWVLDPHDDGVVVIRPDPAEVYPCLLEGSDFSCVVGWISNAQDTNYDAAESSSHALLGTFTDEEHLSASYTSAVDCVGADCKKLGKAWYGDSFRYPCSATAGVAGELAR